MNETVDAGQLAAVSASPWPKRYSICGVDVSHTDYAELTRLVVQAAHHHQPTVVTCHSVHAIVTASVHKELCEQVNSFEAVTPDGQPVRWAMNWLYGTRLKERVYGPALMLHVCQAAADEGIPIYLYGVTPETLEKLCRKLLDEFPALQIAGMESPPFRNITEQEASETIQRMNSSGAGIVFVGLGCPKQDQFAYQHKDRIHAVQLCVGAAFDFHAGVKPMAPGWMQRSGLEWLYRLCNEPRRLWKRYLVTNTLFVAKVLRQRLTRRR